VSLRPWRETDVPAKLMAFGDPAVQRFSWSRTAPYTEADARAYFVAPAAKRRAAIEVKAPGPDTDEVRAVAMIGTYKSKLKPV
jgi:hypothetical protein